MMALPISCGTRHFISPRGRSPIAASRALSPNWACTGVTRRSSSIACSPIARFTCSTRFQAFRTRIWGRKAIIISAVVGDFVDTSVDLVLGKLPHPDQAKIFPGFFPETAEGIEERFAFVSLDVDLYDPTRAGLDWFYDRLNPGGYIFVHDYNNQRYRGVRNAVDAFVEATGACFVPLPDFAGSVVIAK